MAKHTKITSLMKTFTEFFIFLHCFGHDCDIYLGSQVNRPWVHTDLFLMSEKFSTSWRGQKNMFKAQELCAEVLLEISLNPLVYLLNYCH